MRTKSDGGWHLTLTEDSIENHFASARMGKLVTGSQQCASPPALGSSLDEWHLLGEMTGAVVALQ